MPLSIPAAAAFLALLILANPAAADPGRCSLDQPPGPSPRIVRTQLDGLSVNVLLPADYATAGDRRYPVLYLLHGGNYNESTWLRQTELERFTAGQNGDRGVIVVMPDGGPQGFYTDWAEGAQDWETYHLERLIPFIDARFRTLSDRGHRAVAGFSLGGLGAMHYAARRPDLFVAAASFSGLVHLTVPETPYRGPPPGEVLTDAGDPGPPQPGEAERRPYAAPTDEAGCGAPGSAFGDRVGNATQWHNANPADLAMNLRGVALYVGAGSGVPCPDDAGGEPALFVGIEPGALATAREFAAALAADGIDHVRDLDGCGLHSMRSAQRRLAAFWPQMQKAFGSPPPAKLNLRNADPAFAVSGWSVRADPARAPEFMEMRGADASGFTLIGSGTATVRTPPVVAGGERVRVTGARPELAVADPLGRVRLAVDLGRAATQPQFAAGRGTPTFVRRSVRITPAACTSRRVVRPTLGRPRSRKRGRARQGLRSVRATANGRRVPVRRAGGLRVRIDLTGAPAGAVKVRVVARATDGRTLRTTRNYRLCERRSASTTSRRRGVR